MTRQTPLRPSGSRQRPAASAWRRRGWMGGAVLAGLLAMLVVFLQPALSQSNEKKVPICHATSSRTNPYVSESPAVANNGDLQGGHLNHKGPVFPEDNWGDIIPPYNYVDAEGKEQVFPGYNWSPAGQAIWQNDCDLGRKPLTPIVECVEPLPGGGFLAHFGYDNPNSAAILEPAQNVFDPLSANGRQPTVFQPGRTVDAFQVDSGGAAALTWHLTGNVATATADSKHCAGSITIVKTLNPRTDDGRFNLEIDGKVAGGAAVVGDGGTTGTIAVDSGSRTVGESAATGTSFSDYDTQIICVSGTKTVAQGNATSIGVTVSNGEAVLCTITNTLKLASTLEPILECVVFRGGAPDTAVWGYSNPNAFPVSVDAGPTNGFTPAPIIRGQPTIFVPGRLVGAFQSPFSGAALLTWTLGRKTVTASGSSARCTATLELRKVTVPADDPGLFNLQVNGQLWAIGGNGTTTGPITVGVGEGTVSETAGPGTDLSNYDSRVECTRNGTVKVSVPGTKVDGVVGTGDVVVCTFTNTRKSTAPPPGPKPPTPPQPPLPPAPAPPPPLGDLSVVKSASPTSTVVGRKIRWTVTVTNNSTVAAADANVVRVSERAYRLHVISVTPSQGTCTLKGCDLGRLAPGAKATITVVTTAAKAGRVLNVVRVTSEEQESNYLNNTAAAVVRITPPLRESVVEAAKAGLAARTCSTLVVQPRSLATGSTSIVQATARNRYGKPLRGLRVRAVGVGVSQTASTDGRGVARFALTPAGFGIVHFLHAAPRATQARSSCRTLLAVLGATIQKPVTG